MEDYKQKYEDALERARIWKEEGGMSENKQDILGDIFPELKGNEEDKIIEALKVAVHLHLSPEHNYVTTIPKSRLIYWLEKQKERIHA